VDVGKIVDDGMSHVADPASLSPDAKKALVGNLSDRGIFLVRGAVAEVAARGCLGADSIPLYERESKIAPAASAAVG
jgi:predicted transcriptional regulator YheO